MSGHIGHVSELAYYPITAIFDANLQAQTMPLCHSVPYGMYADTVYYVAVQLASFLHTSGSGLAQLVATLVRSTKLLYAGPG